MNSYETILILLYSITVFQIVFYNNKVIRKSKNMHKNRLIKTISSENRYIQTYTGLSIISIGIFYFYLSTILYVVFVIETFILIFSFSSLKKNLQKELNTRS